MRLLKLPRPVIEQALETKVLVRFKVSPKLLGKEVYLYDGQYIYAKVKINEINEKREEDGTVIYLIKFDIVKLYSHPFKRIFIKYSKGYDPYELLDLGLKNEIYDDAEKELVKKILESKSLKDEKIPETEKFLLKLIRRTYKKLKKKGVVK